MKCILCNNETINENGICAKCDISGSVNILEQLFYAVLRGIEDSESILKK